MTILTEPRDDRSQPLDSSRRPSRIPPASITATVLVVVVGFGAAVSAVPLGSSVSVEGRIPWSESKAVRAVAAAVAAVARDMMGGERTATALSALLPAGPIVAVQTCRCATAFRPERGHGRRLDERLLDLPPPRV